MVLGPMVVGIITLGITAAMVVVQSRRDEVRDVTAIVSLSPEHAVDGSTAWQARLDRVAAIHERGGVRLVVIAGDLTTAGAPDNSERDQQYLVSRGVPAEHIALAYDDGGIPDVMQRVAATLRSAGIERCALVTNPYQALRALKIARDAGLSVEAAPVQPAPLRSWTPEHVREITGETLAYLQYLLTR
jgi:uncharacterized SAM-binding protein YcdF (DUF218 family)